MQKIAAFIVRRRRPVMAVMLVIMVLCAVLAPMVPINEDLTAYLPDDSSMKQGMDLMDTEFPAAETENTIRVMVQDLTAEQKQEVRTTLEGLQYADSVDYDDTEEHNRDNQTLYIVSTSYAYRSDEETALEASIEDALADYTVVVKNDDTATERISASVVLAAIAILLVVLFVMCGSWIEPLLFLLTIGIAVVINAGTNYFLGSVSDITNMISALLQLALSMDYSIILMNRYRQELEKNPDRTQAMTTALRNAFSSIASSAITTIVGLLALVFMSFKIGMDLGLVLAKGVLISMLCVFTILPGLILFCTKAIQKTAKKVPHIPMGGLGRFSYRFRIPIALVFVALFLTSYILQGGTQTAFTLTDEDPIADVFPTSNTIVLLYRSEDDGAVTELAEQLVEEDDHVQSAASYSTTLGKPLTAEEMSQSLGAMDGAFTLTPELLRALYYDAYYTGEPVAMTASQFLHFLAEDVLTNDLFAGELDSDMTEKADLLMAFADAEKLTEKKSVAELADTFDMDPEQVEKLMLLYYTNHGGVDTGTMTLPAFADFVANDVAQNPDYASMLSGDALSMMHTLLLFTDSEKMTTPQTAQDLAGLLGVDAETAKLLYVYYFASQAGYDAGTMTMAEFADLIQNQLASNPVFGGSLDENMVQQAAMLGTFAEKQTIQAQRDPSALSQMLGIPQETVEQVFMAAYPADLSGKTMSLAEFTGFLAEDILTDPTFAAQFDDDAKAQLTQVNQLVQLAAAGTKLPAAQMAQIMGMEEGQVGMLYAMAGAAEMSLPEFTDFLVNQILPNDAYAAMFTEEQKTQLVQMHSMAVLASSGQQLMPAQLAAALGMEESAVEQLFTVYYTDISGRTMSAVEFVDFLVNHMSEQLDGETLGRLRLVQEIMDGALHDKAYSCTEMAAMLNLDAGTVKLLYTFRNSLGDTSGWRLSVQTVVHFLLEHKETFAGALGSGADQLYLLQNLIDNSVAGTSYSYDALAGLLGMDSNQMRQLYLLYQLARGDTGSWGISPDEFVSFLQEDVLFEESYAAQMDSEMAERLTAVRALMDAVLSGKTYDAEGLTELLGGLTGSFNENNMGLITMFYGSRKNYDESWTMSMHQLFSHVADSMLNDPRFDGVFDDETRSAILENRSVIEDSIAQLQGKNYSRLILTTTYSDESAETSQFIGDLLAACDAELSGDYYWIGSSVMNYEMEQSFDREMLMITLLTALLIFAVVAISFRSLILPLLLVLIVQCGVFVTVTIIGIQGYSIYYLALLVVQSILMGATIDYGILYTNYYLENRQTMSVKDALAAAYNGSINTILTSGLILVLVTGIVGNLFSNPTIGQICRTISIGALSASLLILFLLPGILAVLDRLIVRRRKGEKK